MVSNPPSPAPDHAPVDPVPRPAGRPRDHRIDEAVLAATADLLVEVGYAKVSIAAIAVRAGTHKPAIYRRWPTKAQLVHEAAFPAGDTTFIPDEGDLAADLTSMVEGALALFGRPVVRAALPGLLAELTADPELHGQLLERFADQVWGAMRERVAAATERGEVRPGVDPGAVLDLVGGAALLALLTRPPDQLDERWVGSIVSALTEGISP
jgi:AcrR family transcriptional regulator